MKTLDLVYIALCAALICVCSWISIPFEIPITLQTFAVFLSVGLLGGKRGTLAVLIYILLGAVGLPVFSGFRGGLGALTGATGGYIIGFFFTALVMWMFEKLPGPVQLLRAVSMVLGLIVCYAFGTGWYLAIYAGRGESVLLAVALSRCVIPFILPDLVKIILALSLIPVLRRVIRIEP